VGGQTGGWKGISIRLFAGESGGESRKTIGGMTDHCIMQMQWQGGRGQNTDCMVGVSVRAPLPSGPHLYCMKV
jgi:hypothetical protein